MQDHLPHAEAASPCARPALRAPQDMDAVSRRYAYSTLQLRFTFMRGLHPFFPPLLEVRPARTHAAANMRRPRPRRAVPCLAAPGPARPWA